MAKDIEDPVFGTLTQWQNGEWEFKYYSKMLDREIEITIEADNEYDKDLPDKRIYSTFKWFNENQVYLKGVIENAAFSHYQEIREEFHQAWGGGEEADEKVPAISSSEEIWKLINNANIWLSTEYIDLSVSFEATWDPEHGITFLFKDKKLFTIE